MFMSHTASKLREIFDRALLRCFAEGRRQNKFKLRWKAHKRGRMQPGVVLEDRNALFDRMEGRR
jgi:hypothetical protein